MGRREAPNEPPPTSHVIDRRTVCSLSGQSPDFLADLQREVALLQRCSHAHLLPLLGHCFERTAPCLVFPLCVGGSLQARLQPSASEHWISLQRLGFAAVPPPLLWQQRLQIVLEACEALIYLHTPTASKPRIVHRDVKPANILLDDTLHVRTSASRPNAAPPALAALAPPPPPAHAC